MHPSSWHRQFWDKISEDIRDFTHSVWSEILIPFKVTLTFYCFLLFVSPFTSKSCWTSVLGIEDRTLWKSWQDTEFSPTGHCLLVCDNVVPLLHQNKSVITNFMKTRSVQTDHYGRFVLQFRKSKPNASFQNVVCFTQYFSLVSWTLHLRDLTNQRGTILRRCLQKHMRDSIRGTDFIATQIGPKTLKKCVHKNCELKYWLQISSFTFFHQWCYKFSKGYPNNISTDLSY